MKTAILLTICLVFVACGRKTGPNSQKPGNSASSSKAGSNSGSSTKTQDCSVFTSADPNVLEHKSVPVKTAAHTYTLQTRPVIYKFSSEELNSVCQSQNGKWNKIESPFEGYKTENDDLKKACAELIKNAQVKKQYDEIKSVIEQSNKSGYDAGYFVEITSTSNLELKNKNIRTYFCKKSFLK